METYSTVKHEWIIKLRYLAVCFQLFLLAPGVYVGYVDRTSIPIYLVTCFFLIFISSRFIIKKIPLLSSITIHLIIDILAFTLMISISGRMENPFWPLIYIHAGIAAILLNPGQSKYYIPFLFGAMLSIHIASYSFHSAIVYTIIPQWIILFVAWFLTRIIGHSLIKQRQQLMLLKESELKLQKQKSLGGLSAGFLHELGTPLNTIRLKVDKLLGEDPLSRQVQTIDKALGQCESIVSNLNIAQHEVAENLLEVLDINILIKEISQQEMNNHKDISIEYDLTDNLKAKVSRVRFTLIFKVLIDNAIEANTTHIKVTTSQSNDLTEIKVLDNGPGFSEFILQEFGSPYISTKGRGRGLGLFSSVLSIESMGGQLNITNTTEGGEVRISLLSH